MEAQPFERHASRPYRAGICYLSFVKYALVVTAATLAVACHGSGGVTLVREAAPAAVVVLGDDPSPVAVYAAEELITHVEAASGVRLPLVSESDAPSDAGGRVFIGATRAASTLGLDTGALENDAFILRTEAGDLYILGKESATALPLDGWHGYSGTMFGVSEVLERDLGVRWLWPGELGTYVPQAETVEVSAVDEVVSPRLLFRAISYNLHRSLSEFADGQPKERAARYAEYPENQRQLGFSTPEGVTEYVKDVEVFMRRHRLGYSQPLEDEAAYLESKKIHYRDGSSMYRMPKVNHSFHGWWRRHGETHPEWFAMRPDGERGPHGTNYYAGMCVSNPDLHRFIIEEVVVPGRPYRIGPRTIWNGRSVLDLGESDVGFERVCHCENCLAWDEPVPELPAFLGPRYAEAPVASNRYARFYKTIYEGVVEKVPDIKITGYLYHNFMPAPTSGIQLNENIIGEFVFYGGPAYFPMAPEVDAWYREQWRGWHETGMTVYFRPNHMLAGYVMPEVTTHQIADFHNYLYEHGNKAVYAESLNCAWAAHGPMSYLQYRLLWDPQLSGDELRQEYFSAFGPAAALVESYFDYWEAYAQSRPEVMELIPDGMEIEVDPLGQLENLRRPIGAALAYPDAVYEPAEAILQEALVVARTDPQEDYAGRVEFLLAGLENARLAGRLHRALDYPPPTRENHAPASVAPRDPAKLLQARQAMTELIEFRQSHQKPYVADYVTAANWEGRIGNIRILYPETDIGFEAPDPEFLELRSMPVIALYDAEFTVPAQNPVGQLWRENVTDTGGQHDPGPGSEIINGEFYNYWDISNIGEAPNAWSASYIHTMDSGAFTHPEGWTATATLRVISAAAGTSNLMFNVSDGVTDWYLSFVRNSTGGSYISYWPNEGNIKKLKNFDLSADYFTVQMYFDPVDETVTFYLNGHPLDTVTREEARAQTLASRLYLRWGDNASAPQLFPTDSRWNEVRFEIGYAVIQESHEMK